MPLSTTLKPTHPEISHISSNLPTLQTSYYSKKKQDKLPSNTDLCDLEIKYFDLMENFIGKNYERKDALAFIQKLPVAKLELIKFVKNRNLKIDAEKLVEGRTEIPEDFKEIFDEKIRKIINQAKKELEFRIKEAETEVKEMKARIEAIEARTEEMKRVAAMEAKIKEMKARVEEVETKIENPNSEEDIKWCDIEKRFAAQRLEVYKIYRKSLPPNLVEKYDEEMEELQIWLKNVFGIEIQYKTEAFGTSNEIEKMEKSMKQEYVKVLKWLETMYITSKSNSMSEISDEISYKRPLRETRESQNFGFKIR